MTLWVIDFLTTMTQFTLKSHFGAHFGSTHSKIGMIQGRLAWHLHKDDMQIREAFHIFLASLKKNNNNFDK